MVVVGQLPVGSTCPEFQIKGGIEDDSKIILIKGGIQDDSKIIFLISLQNHML